MVDWLAKLLNLPPCFLSTSETGGGSIQVGGWAGKAHWNCLCRLTCPSSK